MFEDNELSQAVHLIHAARQLLGFDHDRMDHSVSVAVNETAITALTVANKLLKPVDTPTNTP